ncbi:radial spoke head 14 homolog [Aulostomus maculatus]
MSGTGTEPTRAPVAFGRWAVPQLFAELQQPEAGRRLRALESLCGLMHDPERLHQAAGGGQLSQLEVLLRDEDPPVRTKTCELLQLLTNHNIGRQAVLSSPLLPLLAGLLDDPSPSCRTNALHVLNHLTLLHAGASALLSLVPKLLLKLREEEEEEEVQLLLLSTLSCCSRLDPLPALASAGVPLLRHKLSHHSPNIRREAAAAMMALSVPVDGKQQVCEEVVLPVLVALLQDQNLEVQVNAAGAIMNTAIITTGKLLCLDLDVVPVLLDLVSEQKEEEDEERRRSRKALVIYSLRALTSLAEAPHGRRLLLEQLPLLMSRSETVEEDQDIRRAAQTAIRTVTWTP